MKYPWTELSALMAKTKDASLLTPTVTDETFSIPRESKRRNFVTLVRYALLKGEYDRVVALIEQEGADLGSSATTDAWKAHIYLHAARQLTTTSPHRSLDPDQPPPEISPIRWTVERAAIALQNRSFH